MSSLGKSNSWQWSALPIDHAGVEAQTVEVLRDLLRLDTSNPPGNEAGAADYVATRLRASGIEPTVITSAPGRQSVVGRIAGDGSLPPLLLAAHLDVVRAEAADWSHPPFAAEIHEGYLFGRGALDMKNMLAMALTVLDIARRLGLPIKRDLIVAAVADEEQGCALGSCHLVDEHPELVQAEYMLGEVGGFSLPLFGQIFYPIQVAEKGFCWVRGSVRGKAGHGSMPDPQSAVHELADAVQRVAQQRFPPHLTQPFAAFLRHLSAHAPPLVARVLPHLANERFGPWLLQGLLRSPGQRRTFAALQSNSASVTVLRAGTQTNVIPGHAELEIDGRMLPGQTEAAFLNELRAIVGERLQLEVIRSMPAVVSPVDTPLFWHLDRTLRQHDPAGIPIPYMIPGFTDAKAFSQLGTKCYGFSPVRFPPEDEIVFSELYHGVDERIPIEGFKWGLRVLWDAVAGFCI